MPIAQSRSRLATATCGVENSIATSTPRNFSGVIPCWFIFVSMSSFKPTATPAFGASRSLRWPSFPYPTRGRLLGMVRLCSAKKHPSHLLVRFDRAEQFPLGDFFVCRVRHVNASRSKQKWFSPRGHEHGNVGRKRYDRSWETIERLEMHRRKLQDFSDLRARPDRAPQIPIDFTPVTHQANG